MTVTPDRPIFRTWLTQRTDEELTQLLRLRPDVALPLPPGITPLAARLELRASVGRAMRSLNALELATMEAAADLGAELEPVPATAIVAAVIARAGSPSPTTTQVDEALSHLLSLALIYGDPKGLVLTREAMGSLPQDWQLLDGTRSPDAVTEQLDVLPAAQRAILNTLLNSEGVGTTKLAAPDADPDHPIPRLLNAGLLSRIDSRTVRLPRAVRAALRGQDITRRPLVPSHRVSAGLLIDTRALDRSDQIGAGAGLEVARHLRRLIDLLGVQPVELLKEGGVGVRAVTAISRELNLEEKDVHRVISVGMAAGLLSRGDHDSTSVLAPTRATDEWLEADLATRWLTVLRGWLLSPWAPWLVGEKDEKQQAIRLLSDSTRRDHLPEQKEVILRQFLAPEPGVEISDDELRDDLFYTHPIAATLLPKRTIQEILLEARWIGALAGGTATSLLRAVFDAEEDAQEVATQVTPGTVERVIAQGDMTILAPGPLPHMMQSELDLLGEIESAGLASVYRITESSVRRALDTGRTAEEIKNWLTDHSLGEVPQSINYLVDDVARRHGTLRGGPALSYLRCDDPSLLAEATRTPAAAEVGLHLIAPTVAVAQAPLVKVIDALRAAGFQPVAEDSSGAALDIRPQPARLPDPAPPRARTTALSESRIAAAVTAIRRADDTSEKAPATGSETLALLQAAARGGRTVTLGFVDKQGLAAHRVVTPITVTGGQVDARDQASGQVQRFMLHRITEVLLD